MRNSKYFICTCGIFSLIVWFVCVEQGCVQGLDLEWFCLTFNLICHSFDFSKECFVYVCYTSY